MAALIDLMLAEDGLAPASPSVLAAPSSTTVTSLPLASLSTAVNSALETTSSKCNFNISTTIIQVTETAFVSNVTITVTSSSIAQTVAASSTAMTLNSTLLSNGTTVAVLNTTTSIQEALNTSLPRSSAAASTSNEPISLDTQIPATGTSAPAAASPIPAAATSISPAAAATSVAAVEPTPIGYTGIRVPPASNQAGYAFNAASSKNIAVYFGQTPATGGTTLEAQCADLNVDIVILAFVISQLDGGLYPAVNFGAACSSQTTKMASEAPGLLSCPDLARNISSCQNVYGKKVFLSVGGAASQISFPSMSQASNFGDVLWSLFGPPGNVDNELRPFGNVEIDGFDVGSLSRFLFSLSPFMATN
jgi:hypothetical protein